MTESQLTHRRIAVLGGGISGLAAAYALARARRAGAPVDEFLIEAGNRLGGVIRTENVEGFVIEAGPDSFLTEKPEAAALCRELGLGDSLTGSNDAQRRTYILHCGRLIPLPDGLQLVVPTRLWPMVATPLLPLRSKLRVIAEWFMTPPSGNAVADESVASFVSRHFGDAMVENLVDPLLAGVFGGDSGALSVRSVLPRAWEMEQKYGSLSRAVLKAMKERRAALNSAESVAGPVANQPLFMTLRGGLQQMVAKLTEHLEGQRVHLGRRALEIAAVTADSGLRYKVRCEGGGGYEADAVILALPASECSRILSGLDGRLAWSLSSIPYSSAATVSFAYDAATASELPSGFGFLVPRKEKRRLLACTFVHNKFQHRALPGKALLRCFLGGTRDPEVLSLSEDEIVSIARRELREILGLSAEPLFHRVHRWPSSMAQYPVGHKECVRSIEAQLEKHTSLFLAGNAYSGIGISDCVRMGKSAAERAVKL